MSDFHATERFIGGIVVVGVASLVNWNASQNGDTGMLGLALIAVMVAGGLMAVSGLVELVRSPTSRKSEPPIGLSGSDTREM